MAITDIILNAREIAGGLPSNVVSRYNPYRYGYEPARYGAAYYTSPALTDNAEYRATQYALKHYSLRKPRDLSAAMTAPAGFEIKMSDIVAGWNKDQYKLYEVMFPGNDYSVSYSVGNDDQNKLDKNDWTVYLNPLDSMKPYLRMLNGWAPGLSTLKMYFYYTGPHLLDFDNDTISDENPLDFDPFCYLVASRLLFIASSYYANLSDETQNISVIDNQSKSNMFMQRSKDAYKVFDQHILARINPEGRIDWDHTNEMGSTLFWGEPELY